MDGGKDLSLLFCCGKPKKEVQRPVSTQASSSEVRGSTGEGNHLLSSGKYSRSIEVGNSLLRFIKGKGGCTQERIEKEMGVKIIFPSWKGESIIIEGSSIESITRASKRIQSIVDETVNSPNLDFTHFVNLPLAIHRDLVGKLFEFQNNILGTADQKAGKKSNVAVGNKNAYNGASTSSTISDLGIEKSIFINPNTFHLTVLMLKLWSKERINTAVEVLRRVSSKVMITLDNRPIFVKLEGLDLMIGTPAEARVLHLPVEEVGNEGRLLRACKEITDAFVEAGLVLPKQANQKLKLHATVMNARYKKGKPGSIKRDWFDARGIYERYGRQKWGEYRIREAHLSQRFSYDSNGYYHHCASIPFP